MRLFPHFFALLLLAPVPGHVTAAHADTAAQPATISVTGEGRVAVEPDMATLQVGVNRQAATAAEALALTSEAAAAVLARIEEAGIEARDVQTSALTLQPRWERRPSRDGEMQLVGYEASNILTVRLRELPLLGGLLDATVSDGANTFGGLTFGVTETGPLLDEARVAAVAEAMRKAELLAEAAGVALGPLQSLSEYGDDSPRPPMMRAEMAMDSVPVAAGEVTYAVTVQMVYSIAR
jgi:uncharacterized protein